MDYYYYYFFPHLTRSLLVLQPLTFSPLLSRERAEWERTRTVEEMSSSTVVQGGESSANDLQLPILSVNSKQFLRTSPPIALPGAHSVADLLAISSTQGLLAIGASEGDNQPATCILVHPANELEKLMREAPKGDKPELKDPWRKLTAPEGTSIRSVRFAQSESAIVAGLEDGRLAVWTLANIRSSNVSRESETSGGP